MLLNNAGVAVACLLYRSPHLNAYAERFVRSIKDKCLNRLIEPSDQPGSTSSGLELTILLR